MISSKVIIYYDHKKELRWRMESSTGRILADSGEGYKRRSGIIKNLALVFGAWPDCLTPKDYSTECESRWIRFEWPTKEKKEQKPSRKQTRKTK